MTLTQSELKSLLTYNPQTGIFIWNISRGKQKKGNIAGSLNGKGYLRIIINSKEYLSHRLVFLYMNGKMPTEEVALNGVKGTIKSEDNVCKEIFKEISRRESQIKRCIKKIEYYYSFVELELVLFALKSTASDYFQLSGSGIVNLFNIKPYIIQKYRKLKNITGSGYAYKPKEIKEILELSK